MVNRNLVYHSSETAQFYLNHRTSWAELYPSEQLVLERVGKEKGGMFGRVLDVGCATGGLSKALPEKFKLTTYVGIDINPSAIALANASRRLGHSAPRFYEGDIVDCGRLPEAPFDVVISLGCADWNIESEAIINACWENVAPGGHFVLSLRLTDRQSLNDICKSYQWMSSPENHDDAERANYVVYNVRDALGVLRGLVPNPQHILGYGYWGAPSQTARTPFKRLVFAVFALTRGSDTKLTPSVELLFPDDLHF